MTDTFADRRGVHLEAIRAVMLRRELALQFDDVVFQAPANRCVTIFAGLANAMQEDRSMADLITQSGVAVALHAEAKRRQPQGLGSMPPLIDFPFSRERGPSNAS